MRTSTTLLLLAALMTPAATAATPGATRAASFVYVSDAEDGDISRFVLDPDRGELKAADRVPVARAVMPMTASSDGRFLYAVARGQPYTVHAFRVDGASGGLSPLATAPMPDSMVSITIDRSGRWLLGTSYGGATLSSQAIGSDGRIASEPLQFFPSGGRNAHSIRIDQSNRFVYVPHLGSDEIRTYGFDASSGRMTTEAIAVTKAPDGSGPRHFVLSPDNRFLYLLTEMTGEVIAYQRDLDSGALTRIQSMSTQAADSGLVPGRARGTVPFDETRAIWCADIQITPDGRHLYTSERTRGTLSRFAVDRQTGRLTWLGITPTEAQPRGFAIDPSGRYLIASGEKSPTISFYSLNPDSGALTLRDRLPVGRGANWVQFVTTP